VIGGVVRRMEWFMWAGGKLGGGELGGGNRKAGNCGDGGLKKLNGRRQGYGGWNIESVDVKRKLWGRNCEILRRDAR
jgi:hypothetical protein